MKKKLGIAVLVFLVAVVAVLVVVLLRLGDIIKTAVQTVGPQFTGGAVTLADVKVSPFAGEAGLKELKVGNPEGFKTENAFELGEVKVKMDIGSVTKDTIIINEILIDGPEITYEKSLKKSNIARILENVNEAAGVSEEETEGEEPETEEAPGKKVVIDSVIVKNAKVRLSTALMMGKAVSLPLPTIELEGIGRESDGTSFAEATSEVLKAVSSSVTKVVAKSAEIAGDAVKAVGGAALEGAEAATEAALEGVGLAKDAALKGVGSASDAAAKSADVAKDTAAKGVDAAAKSAGVAVDAAANTGKAVGEGAAKAGKAVGEGASKVVKGIGGLLGRGGDSEKEAAEESATETEVGTD